MKDRLNHRSGYLFQIPRTRSSESVIHNNGPAGFNKIIWRKFSYDLDYYISSAGIKYSGYDPVRWPKPTKP